MGFVRAASLQLAVLELASGKQEVLRSSIRSAITLHGPGVRDQNERTGTLLL